ncbi:MAG: hypothetical protein Q9227_003675 [Pyrenula ochraceoflavens]
MEQNYSLSSPSRGRGSSLDPLAEIDASNSSSLYPFSDTFSPSEPSEAPWNPLTASAPGRSPSTNIPVARAPKRRRINGLSPGAPQYPRGPVSDSGYYTMSSRSFYGNPGLDPFSRTQHLPLQGYSQSFNALDNNPRPANPSAPTQTVDDQQSQPDNDNASQHSSNDESRTWTCKIEDGCNWTGKCESEYKGFPTVNDLERHKHSKHGIEPAEGRPKFKDWKCFAPGCPKAGHIFNRQDNFKAHLNRMHPDLDVDEYMKISEDHFKNERAEELQKQQAAREAGKLLPVNSPVNFDPSMLSSNRWPNFSNSNPNFQASPHSQALGSSSNRAARPQRLTRGTGSHGDRAGLISNSGSSAEMNFPRNFNSSQSVYNFPQTPMSATMERTGSAFSAPNNQLPPTSAYSLPSLNTNQLDMTNFTGNHLETRSVALPEHNREDVLSIDPSYHEPAVTPTQKEDESADADLLGLLRTAMNSKNHTSALNENEKAQLKLVLRAGLNSLNPTQSSSTATPTSPSPADNSKGIWNCKKCPDRTFDRACDLRKHERRHDKPYACTHDNCGKTFGSKADWKRHENTMHVQMEGWRCPLPTPIKAGAEQQQSRLAPSEQLCKKMFFRREIFTGHLRTIHGVRDDAEVKRLASDPKVRIGRDGQTSFWCGFCKDIVTLKEKGIKGNEERFDHIDYHFRAESKGMESWLSANKRTEVVNLLDNSTDSEVEQRRQDKANREKQKAQLQQAQQAKRKSAAGRKKGTAVRRNVNGAYTGQDTAAGHSDQQQKERNLMWSCCRCSDGPWLWATSKGCLGCGHETGNKEGGPCFCAMEEYEGPI